MVFLWPISQPQFGFDWCTGSLNIATFESQKTEFHRPSDGLIQVKYYKVYKCPHPTFRWRPINLTNLASNFKLPVSCWSLKSTSVTNIIKTSRSFLYRKSYGPWSTVLNFKSRHSTSLRAFVYFWKITKTWWDTSIRKIV